MNKKSQFYLILTVFIVSAFLVISSSLTSYKKTTQRTIEIPYSDLPQVTASLANSARNNLEMAFEMVETTGNTSYLTEGVSDLVSGQYLIQEGELGYFLDNFDLGVYNISDLSVLGPASCEIGLPEAKLFQAAEEGTNKYSIEATPGVGNILIELKDPSVAFDYRTNPYVYKIDTDEDGTYEEVIYLTYDYTSSRRLTKEDETYILGETARVYADDSNTVSLKFSNMKEEHFFTLNYPSITDGTDTYSKGEILAIKENDQILGLLMVGKVDVQNRYMDYIVLNLQKKLSGQEKRKVTFDPYPKEGLKDNSIYCNVYPETANRGEKVVITSIVHNNLSTAISDEDLACIYRKTGTGSFEGKNFSEIEPFGFFISEPLAEKAYEQEIEVTDPAVIEEIGYHKNVGVDVRDSGTTFAILGNSGDLSDLLTDPIELSEGESANFLGSYIKVVSIEGTDYPFTVTVILRNPYLTVSNGEILDYNDLPGLDEVYTLNVRNSGLFFGDLSGVEPGDCYAFSSTNYTYVDLDGDSAYDYNETIVLDSDGDSTYDSGEEIKGIPPAEGTSLTTFLATQHYHYADIGDVPGSYDSGDVIFEDTDGEGDYDVGEPVIPTFHTGDFFVLEDYLCFIESYDDTENFFRVVPVYTRGQQESFSSGDYRIFEGFDVNYNPEASKLAKFEYGGKGWHFHDVSDNTDIYFNSYSTVYDENATVDDGAVDDGLVYAFFDGDTTEVYEQDFYYFNDYDAGEDNTYTLSGYTAWVLIEPADGTHPDQFDLKIEDYEGSGEFTITNIREGDTFFVAGQGYKVMGITGTGVFFTPVHSYQFNVVNNLYKKKTLEPDPITDDTLRIQQYTSFMDVYTFYPEKVGTYSIYITYYYWNDLNNDDSITEDEITVVREQRTFTVT